MFFTLLLLHLWKGASASQRCLIWSVVFTVTLALPLTRLVAPHWTFSLPEVSLTDTTHDKLIPLASTTSSSVDSTGTSPIAKPGSRLNWTNAVVGIWAIGGLLLIIYRFIGAFLLYRFRQMSFPVQNTDCQTLVTSIAKAYGVSRPVDIRLSEDCHVPVTWGTWHPVILLPGNALNWPHEWLESALRHEMGHIKNFDHLTRWATLLACAFYWPNPLVWLASKKFQTAQEEASDNLVIQVGILPHNYTKQLIEVIRVTAGRRAHSLPTIAMARCSTLEGRLSAILDESRNRDPYTRQLVAMGGGLAIILVVASGAAQLRADVPPSQAASAPHPFQPQ